MEENGFKVKFFEPLIYFFFGVAVCDLGAVPVKVYSQVIRTAEMLVIKAFEEIPIDPALEGKIDLGQTFTDPHHKLAET